jgi:hypothetical protein
METRKATYTTMEQGRMQFAGTRTVKILLEILHRRKPPGIQRSTNPRSQLYVPKRAIVAVIWRIAHAAEYHVMIPNVVIRGIIH